MQVSCESGFLKFFVLIIVLIMASGCSSSGLPGCGDNEIAETVKKSVLEKEALKYKDQLDTKLAIATEEKSKNDDSVRVCKGTLEISIEENVIAEWKKFNEIRKEKSGLEAPEVETKPLKVEISYKIKKNDLDKSWFVETEWNTFSDSLDYTPIVELRNKQLILQLSNRLVVLYEAEGWLKNGPRKASEVRDYIAKTADLKLENCVREFDPSVGSFDLWCHLGNDTGFVTTYTSEPVSSDAAAGVAMLNLLGILPSQLKKTETIKDAAELSRIFSSELEMTYLETKFERYHNALQ